MNDLFDTGGNLLRDSLVFLKENMIDLFRDHSYYDVQVSNAIALLTIQLSYEYDNKENHSRSMALAEPVCHRLLFQGIKDYYDLRLAVPFILYSSSYEDAKDLMELALKKLEALSKKQEALSKKQEALSKKQATLGKKQSTQEAQEDDNCDENENESWDKKVEKIKFSLSCNMKRRLLLQKYSKDGIYMEPVLVGYNAEQIFQQEYENAMEYCRKNDLHEYKVACEIRKNCYFYNKRQIIKNFDWLRKNEEHLLHCVMLHELNEYGLEQEVFKGKRW